jgi:hypothetical protein
MGKKYLRILVVIITVAVITGASILWINFIVNQGTVQDIKIAYLSICDREIIQESLQDDHCKKSFTAETEQLFVCGNLESKDSIVLSILLYKNPQKSPVSYNPEGDKFQGGWFCRKIILPPDKIGSYEIKVYLFRQILNLSTFIIK